MLHGNAIKLHMPNAVLQQLLSLRQCKHLALCLASVHVIKDVSP